VDLGHHHALLAGKVGAQAIGVAALGREVELLQRRRGELAHHRRRRKGRTYRLRSRCG